MAAKIKCPHCNRILKQEGDFGKQAQGTYRVYDSIPNWTWDKNPHRVLKCLKCRKFFERWDDF